ncbi:hypothetical protein D3C80_1869600 [compost metagenome]
MLPAEHRVAAAIDNTPPAFADPGYRFGDGSQVQVSRLLLHTQLCRHPSGNDGPHAFADEQQLLVLGNRAQCRFAFLYDYIQLFPLESRPGALIAVFQNQQITAVLSSHLACMVQQGAFG